MLNLRIKEALSVGEMEPFKTAVLRHVRDAMVDLSRKGFTTQILSVSAPNNEPRTKAVYKHVLGSHPDQTKNWVLSFTPSDDYRNRERNSICWLHSKAFLFHFSGAQQTISKAFTARGLVYKKTCNESMQGFTISANPQDYGFTAH